MSLDDDASIYSNGDLGRIKSPLGDRNNRIGFLADEVDDINQLSQLGNSVFDDIFYASQDLAEFRYDAFIKEAGLHITDLD